MISAPSPSYIAMGEKHTFAHSLSLIINHSVALIEKKRFTILRVNYWILEYFTHLLVKRGKGIIYYIDQSICLMYIYIQIGI
mgnify:CR=1 FL=1